MKISIINNFDLIRLFAAFQVAILHAKEHLNYKIAYLDWLLIIPGVPVFFFVSGFLIYGSYEKSLQSKNSLKNFYFKRFLRLYPALWTCFGFSVILILLSGYFHSGKFNAFEFLSWSLASNTFFQFYNPEFLSGYGCGVVNGSLWTIAVEIQFYALTPIIFRLYNKRLLITILVIAVFCIINILNANFNLSETIPEKIINVSFLPWIFMFMLGAFFSKYKTLLNFILKQNFIVLTAIYLIGWYLSNKFNLGISNNINPILYILLCFLIVKTAFSMPEISDNLLRRNDISYGIYIFHMPIVNFLVDKNINELKGFIIALSSTIICAVLSWTLIERPVLKIKSNQLRKPK